MAARPGFVARGCGDGGWSCLVFIFRGGGGGGGGGSGGSGGRGGSGREGMATLWWCEVA